MSSNACGGAKNKRNAQNDPLRYWVIAAFLNKATSISTSRLLVVCLLFVTFVYVIAKEVPFFLKDNGQGGLHPY